MSLYDLDFGQFVVDMLPPDKRGAVEVSYLQDVFTAVQTDHDALFSSYRDGSAAGPYSNLNAYNLDEQVIFRKGVYQSQVSNNQTDPTNTDNWVLIQENFIGIIERITYTGQKIELEYALNKWFGTTFRQPPVLSDIYIANSIIEKTGFRIGLAEDVSSTVGLQSSSGTIGAPTPFSKEVGFVINIPAAIYDSLDPIAANRDSIVRSFADKYVIAGIRYLIQTY